MGFKKAGKITVLPSASRTSVAPDLNGWAAEWDECFFIVDISVAGTTLDVAYQVKSIDGNWVDRTALAQIGAVTGLFLLEVPNNIGLESRLNIVSAGSYTYSVTGVGKNSGGR